MSMVQTNHAHTTGSTTADESMVGLCLDYHIPWGTTSVFGLGEPKLTTGEDLIEEGSTDQVVLIYRRCRRAARVQS